jgi:RND family efflux transporter MFP subunit
LVAIGCGDFVPVRDAEGLFHGSVNVPLPVDIVPSRRYGDGPGNPAWPRHLSQSMNLRLYQTSAQTIRVAMVLVLATWVASCGERQQKQAGAPPPPSVTVATPVKRTVSDFDEYVGRFVAVDSVEVRARVSGYLDSVDFKDGQMVKTGDLLFTIDKRPFQYTLDQARANLATAKSNLAYTKSDLERGQSLVTQKTITEQVFEQRAQAFRNAQAAVNGVEAALQQAELDLEFTELRAPINGRIGARVVSPGNLVVGGNVPSPTLLATIVSTDPIYFEFTFDEASYLRYERLSKGGDVASRGAGVPVALKLIDEDGFPHAGRMDFVNNVINTSTGTILARAVFQNSSGVFTPGMFGRVRVPASPPYQALLVPDAAIGSEQTQKSLLVVGADDKVLQKVVTLGQLTPDGLRVIRTGIAPADRVVVDGLMRARAGQKVKPQEQGTKPAGAPKTGETAASK